MQTVVLKGVESERWTPVRRRMLPSIRLGGDIFKAKQPTHVDDKLTFDVNYYRARREVRRLLLVTFFTTLGRLVTIPVL